MGNSSSFLDKENNTCTPDASLLTLVAVSHALSITPLQMLELRQHCRVGSLGQKQTLAKISRPSFSKAMARSHMIQPQTIHIMGHLFTLWDDDGTERVDYLDFCSGTSVLASCCAENASVQQVISFALQVQDVHKTHCITRAKLESLLNGINATAAYFGDAVLSTKQVQTIAHEVFESSQQLHHHVMGHDECARRVARHALVQEFRNQKGQYKYQVSKHVLEKGEPDLIVRLQHDTHGIPNTEIGTSTCSDEHNEI